MAQPIYTVPPPCGTRPEPTGGTVRYSVPQAARRLGISERAVRKRIAAGSLVAESTPKGWLVELPAEPQAVLADPAVVPGPAPAEPRAVPESPPAEPPEPEGGTTAVLTEQERATALATYAATLIAPLVAELGTARQQIADLSHRLGQVEQERDQLAATVTKLTAPAPSWWARWWAWACWWRH